MTIDVEGFAPIFLICLLVAFWLGRATAGGGESDVERMQAAEALLAGLSPETRAEVDRLLAEKKVIEAIRTVRMATGAGLKASKQAVDLLRAGRGR